METGAIRPIQEEAASHVSHAFLVTKPTEDGVRKFRLVIDLRKVNMHLRKLGAALQTPSRFSTITIYIIYHLYPAFDAGGVFSFSAVL